MDKPKQEATEIHNDGSLQKFLDLLIKTYEQNRNYPYILKKELKKLIKIGKDMVKDIKCQEKRQKTQEQQLPANGQQHSSSMEHMDEENKISTPGVGGSQIEEKAERNKFASKEIKDGSKQDVEDKVEVADVHHARCLEKELNECKRDLEAKEREIKSLLSRLPHYNDMRTKQDQRNVEDTLSLNRQSIVEKDFKTFISGDRIDACSKIQKAYKEKTNINAMRLTCLIFEAVYEFVLATKVTMTDAFKEISKVAVDEGPYIGHEQGLKKKGESFQFTIALSMSGSEYPRDVLDGLLLSVKESAPKIDTDRLLEDAKQEILRLAQVVDRERSCMLPLSRKLLDALEDYLKASIQLTWRMVTQVPPLRLEYKTFTYNRDCHKVVEPRAEGNPERFRGQKVYYLWPGLVDGGGKLISPGEVALQQYR